MSIAPKRQQMEQPLLPELLEKYLTQQAADRESGFANPNALGTILPFNAAAVQPVDAKLAWDEARAVLPYLGHSKSGLTWKVPPDWPNLLAYQPDAVGIPFCLSNFPQQVHNYGTLIQQKTWLPSPLTVPYTLSAKLQTWVDSASWTESGANPLLAASILRLAGQYDGAENCLNEHKPTMPAEWQPVWANEAAALEWHRGEMKKAEAIWKKQPAAAPILFNRGLTDLALGHYASAQEFLGQAINQLPEDNAWHHLAGVYLALAGLRV